MKITPWPVSEWPLFKQIHWLWYVSSVWVKVGVGFIGGILFFAIVIRTLRYFDLIEFRG